MGQRTEFLSVFVVISLLLGAGFARAADRCSELYEAANRASLTGNYSDTVRLLEQALVVAGEESRKDILVAKICEKLANVYKDQPEKLARAEELLRRALKIRGSELWIDQMDAVDDRYELAIVCLKRGNFKEAKALMLEDTAVKVLLYGKDSAKLCDNVKVIASCDLHMGNMAQARASYQRLLFLQKRKTRQDLIEQAETHRMIARTYAEQAAKDPLSATRHFKEALNLMARRIPTGDPGVISILSSAAAFYISAGNLNEAEKVLGLWQRCARLSKDELDRLNVDDAFADLWFRRNQLDKAEKIWLSTIPRRKRLLGARERTVGWRLYALGDLYCERGMWAKAIASYEEALNIFKVSPSATESEREVTRQRLEGAKKAKRQEAAGKR